MHFVLLIANIFQKKQKQSQKKKDEQIPSEGQWGKFSFYRGSTDKVFITDLTKEWKVHISIEINLKQFFNHVFLNY